MAGLVICRAEWLAVELVPLWVGPKDDKGIGRSYLDIQRLKAKKFRHLASYVVGSGDVK